MSITATPERVIGALTALGLISNPADVANFVPVSDRLGRETYRADVLGRTHRIILGHNLHDRGECLFERAAGRSVKGFKPQFVAYDPLRGVLVDEWIDRDSFNSVADELHYGAEASSGFTTPAECKGFPLFSLDEILREAGKTVALIHQSVAAPEASTGSTDSNKALCLSDLNLGLASHHEFFSRVRNITTEATQFQTSVIHGRLSPSSLLFDKSGDVAIVDSGEATFGDPALDLAHMMAHLFLASVHRQSTILLTGVGGFHNGYARAMTGPDKVAVMYRAGPLSVAFLLAFIEADPIGRQLAPPNRDDMIEFSKWWLRRRDYTVGQVRWALWTALDMGFNDKCINWRAEFEAIPLAEP